ncbi:thionin-like protein 2 [Durio zibethinus]|uniref:Thionin-like protein 2 n=1 Tax=Durio zibethinus TaxID=66656 RepID=A0A6P5WYA6_DURZI|nr:thionin-like protein 2 [Durio zibethinus]
MEGIKGVLMMVCLASGILVGQSTASFQSCYMGCFVLCVITTENTVFSCSVKCLKDCIIPSSTDLASLNKDDTQYFCKLGCAVSLCANLSSKENPGVQKVGRCVDSCSETCAKTN